MKKRNRAKVLNGNIKSPSDRKLIRSLLSDVKANGYIYIHSYHTEQMLRDHIKELSLEEVFSIEKEEGSSMTIVRSLKGARPRTLKELDDLSNK